MGNLYKKLRDSLSTFWMAAGVSVALLDDNGDVADFFGNPCEYCELIHQEEELQERCMRLHAEAGEQSAQLGNCYFFVCHGNMVHFSIDLVQEVSDAKICIDSPSAKSCVEAIPFCKKPGIINSVSMESSHPCRENIRCYMFSQ